MRESREGERKRKVSCFRGRSGNPKKEAKSNAPSQGEKEGHWDRGLCSKEIRQTVAGGILLKPRTKREVSWETRGADHVLIVGKEGFRTPIVTYALSRLSDRSHISSGILNRTPFLKSLGPETS